MLIVLIDVDDGAGADPRRSSHAFAVIDERGRRRRPTILDFLGVPWDGADGRPRAVECCIDGSCPDHGVPAVRPGVPGAGIRADGALRGGS